MSVCVCVCFDCMRELSHETDRQTHRWRWWREREGGREERIPRIYMLDDDDDGRRKGATSEEFDLRFIF